MGDSRTNLLQPLDGSHKTRSLAHDAGVLPHQILNLSNHLVCGGIGARARGGWAGPIFFLPGPRLAHFRPHPSPGPSAEHQALQQGIAGQPVGAMHAGRSHFAGCV